MGARLWFQIPSFFQVWKKFFFFHFPGFHDFSRGWKLWSKAPGVLFRVKVKVFTVVLTKKPIPCKKWESLEFYSKYVKGLQSSRGGEDSTAWPVFVKSNAQLSHNFQCWTLLVHLCKSWYYSLFFGHLFFKSYCLLNTVYIYIKAKILWSHKILRDLDRI